MKVIDVLKKPRLAEAARVLATPTLVYETELGARRVVGDLADTRKALDELMVSPGKAGKTDRRHRGIAIIKPKARTSDDVKKPAKELAALGLIQKSTDAIVVVGADGMVRFANPAAEKLLGRSREHLAGHEFGFPIAVDRPMELSILRPDQHLVVAELRAVKIDWHGQPAYGAFLRDITAHKETEAALRTSEERFRLMVDGATDYAIVMLDPQGRVSAWNNGAERISGYKSDEVLGRSFSCFHPAEEITSRKAERLLAAASKKRVEDEGWRIRKDGSRFWANVVLTALRDDDGVITGFCKVTRDLTERQELERKCREFEKQELATQLARGVAHRFNNIMCGITVGTELLLLKLRDNDDIRPLVETMKSSAVRAGKITSQLLTFSQNLTSQPQVTDLAMLLRHAKSFLTEALGASISLQMKASHSLLANIDPAQMEILLLNLATNARDAMPGGGEFHIGLSACNIDQAAARRYPELLPGDYVKLVLKDTGCGMSEETQAHMFEPFYTTKDPQRDGLGLAVCQSIVSQNGGCMAVDSKQGHGTSIEILFPRAATDPGKATPLFDAAPLPRGSENILLVDDESTLRKMTASSLRELGYHVVEAGNGVEALRMIGLDNRAEIDALVTDGRMPKMGGKMLARELHKLHPNARVLFISGYPAGLNEAVIVPEFGAAALQKPFTLTKLARKLRELLDQ